MNNDIQNDAPQNSDIQKKRLTFLIVFIVLISITSSSLFLIFSKPKEENEENNEPDDSNIEIQDSDLDENEIVISDFSVQYNEDKKKWEVIFYANNLNANDNYDDYLFTFYSEDDRYLGFSIGNILNNLSPNETKCIMEVNFDGSLIRYIKIVKS